MPSIAIVKVLRMIEVVEPHSSLTLLATAMVNCLSILTVKGVLES